MNETKFAKGKLFAWGRTIHRADSECEVWPAVIRGDVTELVEFADDCPEGIAVQVCECLSVSHEFLMIGSMTGEDEDVPAQTSGGK